MSEYAFGLTVLFFFERLVPALRRLLMFLTKDMLFLSVATQGKEQTAYPKHEVKMIVQDDF